MELICWSLPNLENISENEIREILGLNSKKILDSRLIVKVKSINDYYSLAYSCRSLTRVLILLKKIEFKTEKDLLNKLNKEDFKFIKKSFCVKAKRFGEHEFNSQSISTKLGALILKKIKTNVDFKNPETIIFLDIIDNTCFLCIDKLGLELNKRYYKIKTHYQDLNPCLAFSLVKLSDYKPKKILLDPFCGCGTILIEVALYGLNIPPLSLKKDIIKIPKKIMDKEDKRIKKTKLKIYGLDTFHYNIQNARINSKVAKVFDNLKLFNFDVEWLDTKFKKNSVDIVITNPPFVSKKYNEKEISNLYKQFFNQISYILNNKGNLVIITTKPDLIIKNAKEYKFQISKEINTNIGDAKYKIIIFQCNQKNS